MFILHSFSKFLTLSIILLMFAKPAFSEISTPKADEKTPSIESSTKTVNTGKNGSFDYTHTFYRQKLIKTSEGKSETKREYVTQTLPGEELLAVATYIYKKNIPTKEVIFTLPLPKETMYVEGSATHENFLWFSVDGGKNWSRFQDLRLTEVDGTQRSARGKDITHLQWRMDNNLKKGDTGELEYKIIIR